MNVQAVLGEALAHYQAGRLAEAEKLYRQVLSFEPNPNALHLLGLIAHQSGQNEAAIKLIGQAIAIQPDFPEAHNNLGNALWAMDRLDEAAESFAHAIQLKHDFAEAKRNLARVLCALGNLLRNDDQSVRATQCFREALVHYPDFPEALNNLGTALKDVGDIDQAIDCYRQSLALKPDARAHSNLLLYLHYLPGLSPRELFEEHLRWGERYAQPRYAPAINRAVNRPLRVGYLSADLRRHSVGFFFENLLAEHDRAEVESFCYADVAAADEVTERLKRHAHQWRGIHGKGDRAVADAVVADRIDILVDLAGHTAQNRLLVFARKPAPIQVSYLGYPNTTGLSAVDYRLTDSLADLPVESDDLSVERLVRLDPCAWCYRPPDDAPSVAPRQERRMTFGSFNPLCKISLNVIATWAKLLNAVDHSVLLIKTQCLVEQETRQRLHRTLQVYGVEPKRVELVPYTRDARQHLEQYGRVDVALDTFPYAGTTTTCEALWMGVPVVTLSGQAHAGRVGASLLTNVGLSELVARTPEEYVQIAAELASDGSSLRDLHSGLRERMRISVLMDAKGFARRVESAYRTIWKGLIL